MLFEAVFALEAFNTPGSINQPLLASVERMASRADFDMDFRQCRTCFERIAARAGHYASAVFGMDSCFHRLTSTIIRPHRVTNKSLTASVCASH
jgi:hypothetical protein